MGPRDSSGHPSFQGVAGLLNEGQTLTYERSGPVAPPHELEHYEKVVPGSASRIIDAGLASMKARDVSLDRIVRAETSASRIGATSAALLPWALIATTIFLVVRGEDVAAIISALAVAVTAAARFAQTWRGGVTSSDDADET